MTWMERSNNRRLHPENLILTRSEVYYRTALNYYQADPDRKYRIAKYALGDDYHNFMLRRIKRLSVSCGTITAINVPM